MSSKQHVNFLFIASHEKLSIASFCKVRENGDPLKTFAIGGWQYELQEVYAFYFGI